MTESSMYSPVPSFSVSMHRLQRRRSSQERQENVITIFLFFIAVTPLFKFAVKCYQYGDLFLNGTSSLNDSDQHHDNGNDQQDMNKITHRIAGYAKLEAIRGHDAVVRARLHARTFLCGARPDPKKAAAALAIAEKEAQKANAALALAEIYTEWAPLIWDTDSSDAVEKLEIAVQIVGAGPRHRRRGQAQPRARAVPPRLEADARGQGGATPPPTSSARCAIRRAPRHRAARVRVLARARAARREPRRRRGEAVQGARRQGQPGGVPEAAVRAGRHQLLRRVRRVPHRHARARQQAAAEFAKLQAGAPARSPTRSAT